MCLSSEQDVVALAGHIFERCGPPSPRPTCRRDNQTIALDPDFDFFTEPRLLDGRFWYANTLGVTDSYDSGFHDQRTSPM
jgi:hypothetical protein